MYDTPTVGLGPDDNTMAALMPETPHPPQNGAFAPGTVLAKRYRIVALLGRGGMGEVYRAEDLKLANAVALKFISPALQDDGAALAHLHEEVRNAREVSHPNVCRVYDIGEVDGQHFLTMEYIDGEDLASLLRRIGRLPADKALEISQQICAGLAAAHDAGLLHRDLKPANIMLDGRGRVRITDFGLALKSGRGSQKSNAGTPPYMAPEQISRGETSVRSDIYSLGLVLYEIFTGRLPYKAVAPDTWQRVHQEELPPPLSSLVKDLDPVVEAVILDCLKKDPAERPTSALSVAARLPSVDEAAARSAAMATGSASERRPSGSNITTPSSPVPHAPIPTRMRIALLASLLILVGAALYFVLTRQGHPVFEHYAMQRVIDSQRVRITTISPDGNYIAFIIRDANGSESLWIHNIPTNSERAIVDNPAYKYLDVIFSPDASYVYFTTPARSRTEEADDEYRVPVLGGNPSRVFEEIGVGITFIGKGPRVCVYREYPKSDTYSFINASADGGDEHVLYTGKGSYPQLPTCSPDGSSAVVEDETGKLESIKFSSGSRELLVPAATGRWFYYMQWDPSGKGIFAVTVQKFHYSGQLAYISYPAGQIRAITNDLNDYSGVSVTADAKTIATTQKDRNTHFIDMPLSDPSHAQEHHLGDLEWFTWIDANKLLMSGDDSVLKYGDLLKDESTTLNAPKDHFFFQPSLCGPDALVASGNTADQKNPGVYKMQLDGSVATRLTQGTQDIWPQCTSDGKQLFYADNHDDMKNKVVQLSLDGGTAKPFADGVYFQLARDNKLLALHQVLNASNLLLYAPDTLRLLKTLSMPPKASYFIALSADDKAVFYFVRDSAGASVWKMPLSGAPPQLLANYPGRVCKYMQASPDGSRLGIVAQEPQSQVLLLHDVH
jgi:serine/threonine protein kinase